MSWYSLARHAMVGAATAATPAGRIPPNHAYMVFRFDADRDMVVTWNPWNDDFTPKGEPGRDHGYARADGIAEIASLAAEVNRSVENIGARRLHTILERLLEEISFTATDQPGTVLRIDAAYVRDKVGDLAKNADLSKFIL